MRLVFVETLWKKELVEEKKYRWRDLASTKSLKIDWNQVPRAVLITGGEFHLHPLLNKDVSNEKSIGFTLN